MSSGETIGRNPPLDLFTQCTTTASDKGVHTDRAFARVMISAISDDFGLLNLFRLAIARTTAETREGRE